MESASQAGAPPVAWGSGVVLDTNAVLDLWAFCDPHPAIGRLRADLLAHRVAWRACARMREELEAVLNRGVGSDYGAQPASVLAAWDRGVSLPLEPMPPQHPRLRCRDGDDQVFLDLALAVGAAWLLSSDRDLLALRRRALPLGLRIASPREWPGAEDAGA